VRICPGHTVGEFPIALNDLPESQGGLLRHKCSVCAYHKGKADAAKTEENLRERVRSLTDENALLKAKVK